MHILVPKHNFRTNSCNFFSIQIMDLCIIKAVFRFNNSYVRSCKFSLKYFVVYSENINLYFIFFVYLLFLFKHNYFYNSWTINILNLYIKPDLCWKAVVICTANHQVITYGYRHILLILKMLPTYLNTNIVLHFTSWSMFIYNID